METYTHTLSALSGERSYSLGEIELQIGGTKIQPKTVPYSGIKQVRLVYAPNRFQPNRYLLRIQTQRQGRIEIANTHYEHMGSFSEKNTAFVAFTKAFHQTAAKNNPAIRFVRGTTWANYIFSIIIAVAIGGIVVLAGLFFLVSGAFIIALIKLAILLFFTPLLIRYLKNNKPGTYAPAQIPGKLLPK